MKVCTSRRKLSELVKRDRLLQRSPLVCDGIGIHIRIRTLGGRRLHTILFRRIHASNRAASTTIVTSADEHDDKYQKTQHSHGQDTGQDEHMIILTNQCIVAVYELRVLFRIRLQLLLDRILEIALDGLLRQIIAVEVQLAGLVHTIDDAVLVIGIELPYPALHLMTIDIDRALREARRNLDIGARIHDSDGLILRAELYALVRRRRGGRRITDIRSTLLLRYVQCIDRLARTIGSRHRDRHGILAHA